jgi:hypothetical protein
MREPVVYQEAGGIRQRVAGHYGSRSKSASTTLTWR